VPTSHKSLLTIVKSKLKLTTGNAKRDDKYNRDAYRRLDPSQIIAKPINITRRKWPCRISGDYWQASHCGGPGSIPGHLMWDLLWSERNWDRFSPSTSVFLAKHSTDCSTLINIHHHHPGTSTIGHLVASLLVNTVPLQLKKISGRKLLLLLLLLLFEC
jgi:hypothetical protein